jgi:selenium-binding protein 1
LVAPGLFSGNINFIDVKTNPRAPQVHKVITGQELGNKLGVGLPHTTHCAPNAIMVSMMGGGADSKGLFAPEGNGFAAIDPQSLEIIGRWEAGDKKPATGNDFWYQPRHNVMVSTGFGDPECFTRGFNPAHVADGKYSRTIYIWDWNSHELVQELDCGEGSIPLEVRFLHEPSRAEGYVTCALSGEIRRLFKKGDGAWDSEVMASMPAVPVEGWALPQMPALPTDIVISLDDRFLFCTNWLHGDVRMYDLNAKPEPKLVGQVYIGGSLKKGGAVRRTDGGEQPEALKIKGVEIQGAAHMAQLSLDGKRLYITTSLFSTWDEQFYPEMVAKGNQILLLDVDTENGGLAVNHDFLVDLGAEPFGAGRANEMRLPGGDCTSDIWF